MQPLDLEVAVIENRRDVRCRPPGLSTTHSAIIDDHHALARHGQEIGRRQAGDARAHHADIRSGIAIELRVTRCFSRLDPDGRSAS
jgi:hypothetical protein